MKDKPLIAYVVNLYSLEMDKKIEIVELLLNQGAELQDYRKKDFEDHSIIGDAVDIARRDTDQNEIVKLVKLLISRKENVKENIKGNPLIAYVVNHYSLEMDKKIEIVELLLEKGAELDYITSSGRFGSIISDVLRNNLSKNQEKTLIFLRMMLKYVTDVNKVIKPILQGIINEYNMPDEDKIKCIDVFLKQTLQDHHIDIKKTEMSILHNASSGLSS